MPTSDIPQPVTAERATEIVNAGGAVHRDDRYAFEYRYIVDDLGSLRRDSAEADPRDEDTRRP